MSKVVLDVSMSLDGFITGPTGWDSRFELITRRLLLRPVTQDDVGPLHELWSAPGVRHFLWDDELIPRTRTQTVVDRSQEMFAERSFGLWAAAPLKGERTLSGFGGLWFFRDPPELELLYGVAEPLWGRGYATEIGQAITRYSFERLAMPVVRASTDMANVASTRVLDKLGFTFTHRAMVAGLSTMFYELRRVPVVNRE